MIIRPANEGDIPRVVEMGMRFHQESSYHKHIKSNPEQMAVLARHIVSVGGLLVSERAGQIVGMIGIVLFPHFMSAEMVAGEVFWWVDPDCRGDGIRLLREAEKRAKEQGAMKMQMIAPTEQVGRIYERLGYEFVESAFQKTL